MLTKKITYVKKQMKKAMAVGRCRVKPEPSQSQCLRVPAGFLPVYVGDERERFVVPIRYLSHPLFRMLLNKAYTEFGYEQRNGLIVPCRVEAFREAVGAVEGGRRQFEFGKLLEEFIQTDSNPLL
ncbi:hypothetical protein NMG60_11001474 [Bertholletia excelsa]